MNDGSYKVSYKVDRPVTGVKIEVNYIDENDELVPIRGSNNLSASFKNGVNPKNNEINGP